jgi:uncharacterized membrane protein YqaE (UPF0057 family)
MVYLVAILLPPLAVFLAGRPIQALINIPLTLLVWVPGVIHALFVVNIYYADKRTRRIIKAIERRQRRGPRDVGEGARGQGERRAAHFGLPVAILAPQVLMRCEAR